jgi:hypothetical protein
LEIERAGALLADAMTKRKMCFTDEACAQIQKYSASPLSVLSAESPWAGEICSAEDLVLAARQRLLVLREQELFNKLHVQREQELICRAEDMVLAARKRLLVLREQELFNKLHVQREHELFNKPRMQPSTVKGERSLELVELRRASGIRNHDENSVQRSTCPSSRFRCTCAPDLDVCAC